MTSWSYPDDLPSKSEIVRFWINRLYCLRIFINWYKPKCWACGFNYGGRYDVPFPKNSREDIYRAWERLPLQRCHIVARGLNGAQSSGNLFLMCRECHDSARLTPATTIGLAQHYLKYHALRDFTVR